MDSRQPKPIERWMWLRFIPFKLHFLLPMLGFAIGYAIHDSAGGPIGLILGALIGIPLQVLKYRCAEIALESPNAICGMDEGFDVNRRRNTLQLLIGIVCGGGGSVVGYILLDEGRLIGAACGAFLGFIVGVFLSGLVSLLTHYFNEIRTKILK